MGLSLRVQAIRIEPKLAPVIRDWATHLSATSRMNGHAANTELSPVMGRSFEVERSFLVYL